MGATLKMKFIKTNTRKKKLNSKLELFFQDTYFDIQGFGTNFGTLDEAYLARVLTKLAVSSATIWWSVLEIKDFINLHRKSKF